MQQSTATLKHLCGDLNSVHIFELHVMFWIKVEFISWVPLVMKSYQGRGISMKLVYWDLHVITPLCSLSGGNLTATGAKALARALQENKSLKELKWVVNWVLSGTVRVDHYVPSAVVGKFFPHAYSLQEIAMYIIRFYATKILPVKPKELLCDITICMKWTCTVRIRNYCMCYILRIT